MSFNKIWMMNERAYKEPILDSLMFHYLKFEIPTACGLKRFLNDIKFILQTLLAIFDWKNFYLNNREYLSLA